MGLLMSATELQENDNCIVFDCRHALLDPGLGLEQYRAGHIPRARYANLDTDLSSTPGKGGRHPLPDRQALAEKLRAWGVSNSSTVVCYDQNAGAFAGRLWWLMRWLGHEDVHVLDGGLDAWIAAGYPLDSHEVTTAPGSFTAGEPLTRQGEVTDLPDEAVTLLDARDGERFRGEVEPIDPVAGHIPGAICATFTDNLSEGSFKSTEALRQRFESLGVIQGDDVVCYCGSGVTACHNILALLLAGYPEPALYAGSWSEWVAAPDRPVATGP